MKHTATRNSAMPNETITTAASLQTWTWFNRTLLSVVVLFVLGSLARTLISTEPFEPRKCLGELILSAICAVLMYSMGLMQGMSEVQIVGFGALASLGGVRLLEWLLRIAKRARDSGILDD